MVEVLVEATDGEVHILLNKLFISMFVFMPIKTDTKVKLYMIMKD